MKSKPAAFFAKRKPGTNAERRLWRIQRKRLLCSGQQRANKVQHAPGTANRQHCECMIEIYHEGDMVFVTDE